MEDSTKGLLAVVIAVLIWGSSYAVLKIGLESISPVTFALLRGLIASIFLLGLIFVQNQGNDIRKILKKDLFNAIVLGLIGIYLYNIVQNIGIPKTTSSLASVLTNINPLFILILATVFLQEKSNLNKLLGTIIGFIGMGIIIFSGESPAIIFKSQLFIGNIIMIGAALLWAFYSILNKRYSDKYSPLILTFTAYFFGTIFLLPTAFITENPLSVVKLNYVSWSIVLYFGLVVSAVSFLLWNYSISKVDVSKAASFLYLVPAISIAIGVIFLNETFTTYHLIGTLLVFMGIYLTERKAKSL